MREASETLIEVNAVDASYGFIQVLWGVSLRVSEGEFVGLIGPNGAGKTTLLRCIAGVMSPTRGRITVTGTPVERMLAHGVNRLGLAYVSETLNLFPSMTVEENLKLGGYRVKDRDGLQSRLASVHQLFPRLEERAKQLAGTLSGGERKMLAIGRGLMSRPRVLIIDEPSLGLAPIVADAVFGVLARLNDNGMTILLVEQNVTMTLELTERSYVLEHGHVVREGASNQLLNDAVIRRAYLGAESESREPLNQA